MKTYKEVAGWVQMRIAEKDSRNLEYDKPLDCIAVAREIAPELAGHVNPI